MSAVAESAAIAAPPLDLFDLAFVRTVLEHRGLFRQPSAEEFDAALAATTAAAATAATTTNGTAAPAMPETHCDSPEERANLARYTEFAATVLNGADPARAAGFYAPQFTWHDAPERMPAGAAPMQRLQAAWRAAYPDAKVGTVFYTHEKTLHVEGK